MLCRITDDPSYDYSDYCEGKGYYAQKHEITEREDDPNYDPDDPENWEDAYLYPPLSPEEEQERLAFVKWQQELKAEQDAERERQFQKHLRDLERQFGGRK